jgi:hypothetical protein
MSSFVFWQGKNRRVTGVYTAVHEGSPYVASGRTGCSPWIASEAGKRSDAGEAIQNAAREQKGHF